MVSPYLATKPPMAVSPYLAPTDSFPLSQEPTPQARQLSFGRKGSYGKVNWSEEPCFVTDTTFFVDHSTTQNDLRWLYWLFQTLQLDEGSEEAAIPGLNRESAYAKDVFVPGWLSVQRTIADYLDRETARLDALVAAKERVLKLLSEKRQALIVRAVTRGIDPSVSYRDSGIPWLGDIPTHWAVCMIARLFREYDERGRPDLPLLEGVDRTRGRRPRVFQ